jgi:hypothetical protein
MTTRERRDMRFGGWSWPSDEPVYGAADAPNDRGDGAY